MLIHITSFYDTDYTKESKSDKYSNICTFSWKKHFRVGLDIMINFNKLADRDSGINDEVSNDIAVLKEELYSSLKGNYLFHTYLYSGEFYSEIDLL